NSAAPTLADAGTDQQICGTAVALGANSAGVGVGEWSIVSGTGGSIASINDPGSAFTGVEGETYVLRWTITNGVCVTQDVVQIVLKRIPDAVASDVAICSGASTSIAITNPNGVPGTTFNWTVVSATNVSGAAPGSGTLIGQVLTNTNGTTSGTVVYRITPTASGCDGPTHDVTVTVNPTPVITTPAVDLIETICSGETLSFLPASSVAGTTFSWTASVSGGTASGVTLASTG